MKTAFVIALAILALAAPAQAQQIVWRDAHNTTRTLNLDTETSAGAILGALRYELRTGDMASAALIVREANDTSATRTALWRKTVGLMRAAHLSKMKKHAEAIAAADALEAADPNFLPGERIASTILSAHEAGGWARVKADALKFRNLTAAQRRAPFPLAGNTATCEQYMMQQYQRIKLKALATTATLVLEAAEGWPTRADMAPGVMRVSFDLDRAVALGQLTRRKLPADKMARAVQLRDEATSQALAVTAGQSYWASKRIQLQLLVGDFAGAEATGEKYLDDLKAQRLQNPNLDPKIHAVDSVGRRIGWLQPGQPMANVFVQLARAKRALGKDGEAKAILTWLCGQEWFSKDTMSAAVRTRFTQGPDYWNIVAANDMRAIRVPADQAMLQRLDEIIVQNR